MRELPVNVGVQGTQLDLPVFHGPLIKPRALPKRAALLKDRSVAGIGQFANETSGTIWKGTDHWTKLLCPVMQGDRAAAIFLTNPQLLNTIFFTCDK